MEYLYVWGKVVRGRGRGKALGYPTANIRLHKLIDQGVYVSRTKLGNQVFNSMTFIGAAETFDEKKIIGETHILKFDQDIYGDWISIILLQKIRGNMKFESKFKLIEQMNKDKKHALNYFKTDL